MNISALQSVNNLTQLSNEGVSSASKTTENNNATFENLFQAALGMVKDANQYTSEAQEAEMAYSLGLTDNTHDLAIAQQKANLAVQYTVAVRNQALDAYKEIMNLQF